MQPHEVVHISVPAIAGATPCTGRELVEILRAIEAIRGELLWYAADVQTIGPFPVPPRDSAPTLIGDTVSLMKAAERVDQFESGVFVGVPSSIARPSFRAGGLWTEDDERADLGDGVVEVRAFDTSYWSLATADAGLAGTVLQQLMG